MSEMNVFAGRAHGSVTYFPERGLNPHELTLSTRSWDAVHEVYKVKKEAAQKALAEATAAWEASEEGRPNPRVQEIDEIMRADHKKRQAYRNGEAIDPASLLDGKAFNAFGAELEAIRAAEAASTPYLRLRAAEDALAELESDESVAKDNVTFLAGERLGFQVACTLMAQLFSGIEGKIAAKIKADSPEKAIAGILSILDDERKVDELLDTLTTPSPDDPAEIEI